MIPAGQVKPMSEDDKWKEAKRLLPLIKYELPKNKDFAIYVERTKLKLSNDDSIILNQVQDEISQLLVRSGLYHYNPPDNKVWLKRVPVDDDSELKHEILKFLHKTHLQFFRKALAYELNIDVYKLDYLTENMKNDGAINKIDASSKEGKDYIIEISDEGNGMYLNDYYLKPSNGNGYTFTVHNDFSKKVIENNQGIVNTDTELNQVQQSTGSSSQKMNVSAPAKAPIINKIIIGIVIGLAVILIAHFVFHIG